MNPNSTRPQLPSKPAKPAEQPMSVTISLGDYVTLREYCTAKTLATGKIVTHRAAITEALHLLFAQRGMV